MHAKNQVEQLPHKKVSILASDIAKIFIRKAPFSQIVMRVHIAHPQFLLKTVTRTSEAARDRL